MWSVATAGLDGLSSVLNIFEGSFPCFSLLFGFLMCLVLVSGEADFL